MKFRQCPNCTNYEKGYKIIRCCNCGKFGCLNELLAGHEGCWIKRNEMFAQASCPNCGQSDWDELQEFGDKPNIQNYEIFSATDPNELGFTVHQYIKSLGYTPIGGIVTSVDEHGKTVWSQAMIQE